MWIGRSCWRSVRGKVRPMTHRLYRACWKPPVRSMPIGLVLADAEFDSEANHPHIRATGALSVIPARRRGLPNGEIRNLMYRKFPRKLYGPRAKIETVFSVIKRKLSAKAPGRTLPMQVRQALLLGLAFNLYRLRHPGVIEDVNRAL